MKSYYDFMKEISADELYDGLLGFGFFAETLPPVFTAEFFLNYCRTNPGFGTKEEDYIVFNSMRNTSIPRRMGIPSPFKYEILCSVIKKNWHDLIDHFKKYTQGQQYPVSRIHLRKIYDKDSHQLKHTLFEMNYKNWKDDCSPENDLLIFDSIVSQYIVHADISTCFPSIYTHSLAWALAGKDIAKQNRNGNIWYNKIDRACQNVKNGETHGLIIGPHASNLLSEIILVVIDKNLLDKGYRFYRNIDDYNCYVETHEEANRFLCDLEFELRQFDLTLNHKKSKTEKLPIANTEHWIHKLNTVSLISSYGQTSYIEVNNYLDLAIKLATDNENNAVLKYAVKRLADLENITNNGKAVASKRIMHLAVLYPYLLPVMEKYVLNKYNVKTVSINEFANALYYNSLKTQNYEGICYAIYYSLRYHFDISNINCNDLIMTADCLCLLFAWLYYKNRKCSEVKCLKKEALKLCNVSMGRYWLFIYEVLNESDLSDDWKAMKKHKISFIDPSIFNS